jgi:hypothetical protein
MTVRIHRTLDSETLYLPEIRPLIGKSVEIIVREESSAVVSPAKIGWDAAMKAVEGLEAYDFDALDRQRDYDVRHAQDHLP